MSWRRTSPDTTISCSSPLTMMFWRPSIRRMSPGSTSTTRVVIFVVKLLPRVVVPPAVRLSPPRAEINGITSWKSPNPSPIDTSPSLAVVVRAACEASDRSTMMSVTRSPTFRALRSANMEPALSSQSEPAAALNDPAHKTRTSAAAAISLFMARSLLLPHGNPHNSVLVQRAIHHVARREVAHRHYIPDAPLAQRLTGHLDHDAAHGGHQGHPVAPVHVGHRLNHVPRQRRPFPDVPLRPHRDGQIHGARYRLCKHPCRPRRVGGPDGLASQDRPGRDPDLLLHVRLDASVDTLVRPAVDHDLQRHRDVAQL